MMERDGGCGSFYYACLKGVTGNAKMCYDSLFAVWIRSEHLPIVIQMGSLLTKMSTRNLPGGKGWPAGGADNLTAICEPIV
jgi:hypothetical protein